MSRRRAAWSRDHNFIHGLGYLADDGHQAREVLHRLLADGEAVSLSRFAGRVMVTG